MKKIAFIVWLILMGGSIHADAGPYYQYGNIVKTASVPEGLLITLDSGVPDNCVNSPGNFLIIPEENKVMVAHAMMLFSTDKKYVCVYTDGTKVRTICRITQFYSAED